MKFNWWIIPVCLFIIGLFGVFITLSLSNSNKEEQRPCYFEQTTDLGYELFVVGISNGNGGIGYYQVSPEFEQGEAISNTKDKLNKCDNSNFKNLINEIELRKKVFSNDAFHAQGE